MRFLLPRLLRGSRRAIFWPLPDMLYSSRWVFVKSSGTGITPVCITLAVDSAFALWTRRGVAWVALHGRGSQTSLRKAALTGALACPFTGARIETSLRTGGADRRADSPLHGDTDPNSDCGGAL